MPLPILTTKLYRPAPPVGLVTRPRLVSRLNDALGMARALTLLSAPAGFGKTTLVSEWMAAHPARLAWLSLDEEDNEPTRFLAYLAAAFNTLQPGAGEAALALLGAPQPPPPRAIVGALINALSTVPGQGAVCVLVLDDYHVIATPLVHEALTFLLDHRPPALHLVITSRADPPLPLSRLRARGQLTELRAADLRFTPEEASAFLNEVMGLNVPPEAVAALEARTEGWIAGLQLAALSIQGRDSHSLPQFIAAFAGTHRHILDYLAEEVFQRQPPHIQNFLKQTAILDRLCAPLCEAVIGDRGLEIRISNLQSLLEHLEHSNLFLLPLDDERRWYRYHHLFADVLRTLTPPEQTRPWHRRASEWFVQNGEMGEAMRHALAACDIDFAARLVEEAAGPMLSGGDWRTLLGWFRALPDDAIRARPALSLFYAWALVLTGQTDAAEARLAEAESHQIDSAEWRSQIAAIRGQVAAQRGDIPHAIEHSREALALLREGDALLRGIVALNLGSIYATTGRLADAEPVLAESHRASQIAGNAGSMFSALGTLAQVQLEKGRLRQAAGGLREGLQRSAQMPGPLKVSVHMLLGTIAYEWDQLEEAGLQLSTGLTLAQQFSLPESAALGAAFLAQVRQAQGQIDSALDLVQGAQAAEVSLPLAHLIVGGLAAQLALARGDLESAGRWQRERAPASDGRDFTTPLRKPDHVALVQMLLAQGRAAEAEALSGQLARTAEAAGWIHCAIPFLALQTVALQAQGKTADAQAALSHALELAEPGGYVRTFVDLGEPMQLLMADFRLKIGDPTLRAYAGKLLTAFSERAFTQPARSIRNHKSKIRSLPEPLSERELEVLRLIAAGDSNREIAAKLVISLGAVKKHLNNIFGKLEAGNRTQAVARARELGLL
jgi:LuxR family maltose regulon positive regulatory protein